MRRYNFRYLTREWHSREFCRRSFKRFYPSDAFINLAKAGFFFQNDSVICFSCFLKIEDWTNIKNPLITHCLSSPKCNFLIKQFGIEGIFDIQNNYIKNFTKKTFICTICELNYIDRFLSCGHTFCSHCLKKLQNSYIEQSRESDEKITPKCPNCRCEITNENATFGPGYSPENN